MARLLNSLIRPLLLILAIAVVLMIAFRDWDWRQIIEPRRPPVPADAVVCPTFHYTNRRDVHIGTAFILNDHGRRLLVTAFHLLLVPATAERKELKSIDLYNSADRQILSGQAGRPLLDYGKVSDGIDLSTDCAVFDNPQTMHGGVLYLADKDVALDDRVWIAGKSYVGPAPNYVAARVASIRKQNVLLMLRRPNDFTGFSGSPVLDSSGRVVGICLMATQDGRISEMMRLADLRARIADAERTK